MSAKCKLYMKAWPTTILMLNHPTRFGSGKIIPVMNPNPPHQCYEAEIIYFWLRFHLCPLFWLRLQLQTYSIYCSKD